MRPLKDYRSSLDGEDDCVSCLCVLIADAITVGKSDPMFFLLWVEILKIHWQRRIRAVGMDAVTVPLPTALLPALAAPA